MSMRPQYLVAAVAAGVALWIWREKVQAKAAATAPVFGAADPTRPTETFGNLIKVPLSDLQQILGLKT